MKEGRRFYAGNLDKLRMQKPHGGSEKITPFIIFQAGEEDMDTEDDGEAYLAEIAEELEGKLDVPYFVSGIPISIFIVSEVG